MRGRKGNGVWICGKDEMKWDGYLDLGARHMVNNNDKVPLRYSDALLSLSLSLSRFCAFRCIIELFSLARLIKPLARPY